MPTDAGCSDGVTEAFALVILGGIAVGVVLLVLYCVVNMTLDVVERIRKPR